MAACAAQESKCSTEESLRLMLCFCLFAGLLGRPGTQVYTGEDYSNAAGTRLSIFAAFFDPQQLLATAAGTTLRLTGYSTDNATGLHVCYVASVDICAAASAGAG